MPAELIPAMFTILAVDPYPVQMVPAVARPTLTIEQQINTSSQLGWSTFDER